MKKPVVSNSVAALVGILAFTLGMNQSALVKNAEESTPPSKGLVRQELVKGPVMSRGGSTLVLEKERKQVNNSAEQGEPKVRYLVVEGDSLYAIAKAHGTTMESIMYVNELTTERLNIGQQLSVPTYKVKLPEGYDPLGVIQSKLKQKKEQVQATAQAQGIISTKVQQTKAKVRTAESKPSRGSTNGAQMLSWEEAAGIFRIGSVAKVTDVATGLTFEVKRKGGSQHADAEPLTKDDTQVMKRLYGSWSWDRRAIILEVGSKRIAASMNGMPHGQAIIEGNGFPGHFCIHFLGSKTHGSEYTQSRKAQTDPQHQAMIRLAAGK